MAKFVVMLGLLAAAFFSSLFCLCSASAANQQPQLSSSNAEIFDKVHVDIANDFSTNVQILVHCKSKNDDLGSITLSPKGTYSFSFRENFWGTTLYFCSLTQVGRPGKNIEFEAFNARRDTYRCKSECRWVVNDKGLQGYNESKNLFDVTYNWP